jgi:hypothetical protein
MNDEKNRYLVEKMGWCWHEFKNGQAWQDMVCLKCGKHWSTVLSSTGVNTHIDCWSWHGYGILFAWAKKQWWWADGPRDIIYFHQDHVDPSWFAEILTDYFRIYWDELQIEEREEEYY